MDNMETLGLSSPRQKEDNFFQRLFWPTIHNQYDVDLLGAQGFWIATAVGLLSGVVLLIGGQWLAALIVAFVFIAGGCGVRERSVPASILIFVLYALTVISNYVYASGHPGNPVFALAAILLLLSNIRATVMSETWFRAAEGEGDHDLPERMTVTFKDRLANQLPLAVWPKVKYPFFIIAVGIIFLVAFGLAFGPKSVPKTKNSNPTMHLIEPGSAQ